jgi:Uma2 family endonuclease
MSIASPSPAQRLLTAEEFMLLPEPPNGARQELVRGRVVIMPLPQGRHGIICSRTDRRVGTFVETHELGITTSNDAGVILGRNPDTVRGPDIAFYSKERLPVIPEGYFTIAPDLAIEVLSPSDVFSKVLNKVSAYLKAGVRMVWVIDPEDRTITVFRAPDRVRTLDENDTLSGEDVLPGFTCAVADLLQ